MNTLSMFYADVLSAIRPHVHNLSDQRFRERYQPEHHTQSSILEDFPIDMIQQFPIADSLHLIELGVMER